MFTKTMYTFKREISTSKLDILSGRILNIQSVGYFLLQNNEGYMSFEKVRGIFWLHMWMDVTPPLKTVFCAVELQSAMQENRKI